MLWCHSVLGLRPCSNLVNLGKSFFSLSLRVFWFLVFGFFFFLGIVKATTVRIVWQGRYHSVKPDRTGLSPGWRWLPHAQVSQARVPCFPEEPAKGLRKGNVASCARCRTAAELKVQR